MALVSTASVLAHHSLANHDTTKAVRVKGTIVQVNLIDPHSIIYLEEKTRMDRFAGGPSKARRRFNSNEWASPLIS